MRKGFIQARKEGPSMKTRSKTVLWAIILAFGMSFLHGTARSTPLPWSNISGSGLNGSLTPDITIHPSTNSGLMLSILVTSTVMRSFLLDDSNSSPSSLSLGPQNPSSTIPTKAAISYNSTPVPSVSFESDATVQFASAGIVSSETHSPSILIIPEDEESDTPLPIKTQIPEPATLLLFGTGITGLAAAKFRKKK